MLIASSPGKGNVDLEESSTKGLEPKAPRIKEVLKERKVLEKKVALSKKRKKDSRYVLFGHIHIIIFSRQASRREALKMTGKSQTLNVCIIPCL